MKKITIISFLLSCTMLLAQTTYVPDDNFEQALINLGYDDVLDDYVLTANIEGVTLLHVPNINISDLTGVEDFTALTNLNCYNNQLSTLDVSQNTALTNLLCYSNYLNFLDVSLNVVLTELKCNDNQLSSLDVSQNIALIELGCQNNQLIDLDVSQNTMLEFLSFHFNQLTTLDVSHNSELTLLGCGYNQLTTLDVSQNTMLEILSCYGNQLISLNVSQNMALTKLLCDYNALSTLDISQNTALTWLHCDNNSLSTIDISQNTALTRLQCFSNQLTTLDVSQNIMLEHLNCYNNQLSTLDVSQNTILEYLNCYVNQLSSLDVRNGNNPLIDYFYSGENPDLTCIFVDDAEWSTANWTSIDPASTFVETQEECYALDHTYVPDDNFEQALIDLGYDDVLNDYVLTANIIGVISLDVSYGNISDLAGIEDFIALTGLNCNSNQLISLDVSQNPVLESLNCSHNQLTVLDVSQNTSLYLLFCYDNLISSLDVSQNVTLTDLWCADNQLSTLDLSQNTALTYLRCNSNQLTSLDIRNGFNLNIINSHFLVYDNPNLACIFVDDAEWSAANWTNIDPTSTFVETQAECDALGVDEVIFSEGLQVYPNPTEGILSIKTTDLTDKKYSIYDIYGSISKQGVLDINQIDISNLNAGIYLFKLGDMTTKIVKL